MEDRKRTDTPIIARLTVLGEPASKANGRRIVFRGGSLSSIKSKKALSYADAFRLQVRPLRTLLLGDLAVDMTIYYRSRRPDLDESLILDLLQGVVYVNDRQVRERHTYHGLDPVNPRVEIAVRAIPPVLPMEKSPSPSGARRRGR